MEWFGRSYKNFDFEIFSLSHFIIIGLLIIGGILLYYYREHLRKNQFRIGEIIIASSLIVFEGTYHFWMIRNHSWNISHALPLELCSISLILTVVLLFTKKKIVYEILIFTALLGASQAIFTPIVNYDFPHFRFFHFFYTHLMTIWVALYFTWVKEYRPTIWSVFKLFIFLNLLLPIILLINNRVGGNYLFLNKKPPSPSLMDFLGPYPWYILSLEGLLIGLSIIVWLIFREKTSRKASLKEENPLNSRT
ncbi:TIGR02206 family membrane protein [Bacillus sp. DNRA2]|uniref:YwaF family protein n=1 Tax=Bacillus sp. DNRA2 TaxID=2723053 RepID=UPI00145CB112|nr:TIGR02206 family membrane protein [Bacillus sp. DNRA2]NMD72587.1 TIGR02206 family membrane protein [Bacillus sp. DNRA2]